MGRPGQVVNGEQRPCRGPYLGGCHSTHGDSYLTWVPPWHGPPTTWPSGWRYLIETRPSLWLLVFGVLLPLDGGRGLAGHVQHDAVDLRHLVGDPGRDRGQHRVRQPGPVGGHRVLAGHRAEHDRVAVAAPVALDADRADVGEQHHRALPDLAVQAGRGKLGAGDRVRVPDDPDALAGDLADDPDRQAGAGERLAPHDPRRQPELAAYLAHLILEQRAQRLDPPAGQVLPEPAHVVAGPDSCRHPSAAPP